MRKQNTKIHTDFEVSICRLRPSVFISLYNMQHWRYTLRTPRLRCYPIIAPSVSVAYLAQSLLLFLYRLSVITNLICPVAPADKISTWTTGTSLSWSTMRNKMMKSTRVVFCKCYELLLVCRSFPFAFRPLAGRVQVAFEQKPLLLQREYSLVMVNSPSTTVKWLRSHGQSLQRVHGRCIFASTGTVLKPPVGGGSSAVLSGLHHLAAILDRDPPASH